MATATRFLVTGGAGFIGSALVRRLVLERGADVVTVDKLAYAGNRLNLRDVDGDRRHTLEVVNLCDGARLADVFERHRPDVVMHLAAESHVDRSIDRPADFIASNIVGSYQLLECALAWYRRLDAGARERFRVLHVSTDEVYGSLETGAAPFREGDAYRPNSPYAASKAAADHLALAWQRTYGLPVLVSNCTNNYGPYQFPEKLIPVVVLRAIRGEPIPLYGRGENVRDWLHVDDHVDALLEIAAHGRIGERYNVGAACEIANADLVARICSILDELRPDDPQVPHASLVRRVEDRPGHDLRYAMDAARLHGELGWAPRRTFEDGLRETVEWYLHNLDWCEQVTSGAYAGERIGLGARAPA